MQHCLIYKAIHSCQCMCIGCSTKLMYCAVYDGLVYDLNFIKERIVRQFVIIHIFIATNIENFYSKYLRYMDIIVIHTFQLCNKLIILILNIV